MKVGIVSPTDWIRGQPIGGSSRVISSILPYLAAEVHLLGLTVGDEAIGRGSRMGDGLYWHPLFRISYPSRVPIRLKAAFGYCRSKRRVAEMGLDVLYVHTPEAALPFVFGTKIAPAVFHQHGSFNPVENSDFSWARNRFFKMVFDVIWRLIYARADAIIAIDRPCYQSAVTNGGAGKAVLITNPVDSDKFRFSEGSRLDAREKLGLASTAPVVFFGGRLSRKKNVHLIIDAVAHSRSSGCKWYLAIAGEGALAEPLRNQVARLDLTEQVLFLGPVLYENMPAFYSMADAVVLPSADEGVPMMLLEAIACGTPVVATSVGGIPEIVEHGLNGYLVSRTTPERLAEAVERCLERDWDRSAVAASVSEWSANRIAQRISDVLEKAIAASQSSA